jgi:hypothetical protein
LGRTESTLPVPSSCRAGASSIGCVLGLVLAAASGCERQSDLTVNGVIDAADSVGTNDGGATLPSNRTRAIAISMGRLHACALLEDHRVKCWGGNSYGELGLGDTKNRGLGPTTSGDNLPTVDLGTGRTAKSVTAGVYATCAILDDDELKCWGIASQATPNPTGDNIGDQPHEMGDLLKAIDLGAGRVPVAVAMGFDETCVALDDGSLLCWSGEHATRVAAAPDGARVVQLASALWTVGLFDDGSVRQISPGWPAGLAPLDLGGRQASFIAASHRGYCAVLRGGGAPCTFGARLPSLPTDASVVALAVTEAGDACGLDSAGVVTCRRTSLGTEGQPWAAPIDENTARQQLDQPATALSAGEYNVCALLADGSVKCWALDGSYPAALGGSIGTATEWPAVDLGTRPAP